MMVQRTKTATMHKPKRSSNIVARFSDHVMILCWSGRRVSWLNLGNQIFQ